MAQKELKAVGVIGAGAMGRGIAQVCAAAGCEVQLFDMNAESVTRALDSIRQDLAQGVARGKLSQEDADATLARMRPAAALSEMSECDLVVEAIVEQLEPKQQVLRTLEGIVRDDCVLATNTSSLSVTAIAAACAHPQRVAGWHFFNPVTRMRLAEIIQAPRTATSVIEALVELTKRVGHRAVVTSDSPGFVVNHAGRAFVTEGLKLLSERTAEHSTLDDILRECAGFKMGPCELLDLTGLDVSVPVMESIHAQYYGDDRYRPVPLARTRWMAGLLGRKSGQGFYRYPDEGTKAQAKPPVPMLKPPAVWWPVDGHDALPETVTELLEIERAPSAAVADLVLVAPIGSDLSSSVVRLRLIPAKVVAVDPLFASHQGVTLMTSPATSPRTADMARSLFAARSIPTFVIADSPGYVAPRVVACIVNLACEMAQQGIASPEDIDVAVRMGLGYPMGPFEWGEKLGAVRVRQILEGLYTTFGDQRYRPSPWLVRRSRLGLPLSATDRQH